MTEMVSEHFSVKELRCPCCGDIKMDSQFMNELETFRRLLGRPIVITSAYRCNAHNKKVGGTPNSLHLFGRAVDIAHPESWSAYTLVEIAVRNRFGGIGVAKSFIHIDNRPISNARLWTY